MTSPVSLLARRVDSVMEPPPPVIDSAATCGAARDRMVDAGSSSVLIAGPDGRPAGIVTEQDVTRRVAFRAAPDDPVADVMSRPVHTVRYDDYLYRAIGTMRRLELQHMPVIGRDGAPVGMLHMRHALADATADVIARIDRLTQDDSEAGLAAVKDAEADVAAQMVEDGIAAADIQALLTHINKDVHRRVVDRAVSGMVREGLGTAPVPFTVVVMGSGGRAENFLCPDQDNGFILGDYPDDEHDGIDGYFIALAERMTRMLDAVGFPLCKGGVMATNPVWRKTLPQWRAQTGLWARRRSVTTVRLADIFFDFQPVFGEIPLATALRRHVTVLMRGNIAFLREIHLDQTAYGTALGLFRRLRTDDRGEIDIKRGGLLPLVNAIRILSLRDGVAVTPTLARIAALEEMGTLSRDEATELAAAFRHMSDLVLRHQVERYLARRPIGYGIPPRWMSRYERRQLVDGLRGTERLRDRVRSDLTGDVF